MHAGGVDTLVLDGHVGLHEVAAVVQRIFGRQERAAKAGDDVHVVVFAARAAADNEYWMAVYFQPGLIL